MDCKRIAKDGIVNVYIPVSAGDDSEDSPVAPKIGKYLNSVVKYENGHVYVYDKNGIFLQIV